MAIKIAFTAEAFTLRAACGDGIGRLTAGNYGGRPGGEA